MNAAESVERPDLTAVKRRLALRSSNAAVPIPSGKRYKRKAKHGGELSAETEGSPS